MSSGNSKLLPLFQEYANVLALGRNYLEDLFYPGHKYLQARGRSIQTKGSEYEKKKSWEIAWYEQKHNGKRGAASTILHHPAFFAPERNSFNYIFPKIQMREVMQRHLKGQKVDKLLIAPCGTGDDLSYLGDLRSKLTV